MTGPEHYHEAETALIRSGNASLGDEVQFYLSVAQVHATLALAAAMAEPRHGQGIGRSDERDAAWKTVL